MYSVTQISHYYDYIIFMHAWIYVYSLHSQTTFILYGIVPDTVNNSTTYVHIYTEFLGSIAYFPTQ